MAGWPVTPSSSEGRVRLRALLFLLVLGAATTAAAASLAVVANPGLEGVPPNLRVLSRIYRRQQRISTTGSPLVPVNLPAGDPLRRVFSLALFGQPPEAMLEYWDQMYFHGISPPKVLESQAAVLRFVAATPGAIGYVAGCRTGPGVRVLLRLPLPAGSLPEPCGAAQAMGGGASGSGLTSHRPGGGSLRAKDGAR